MFVQTNLDSYPDHEDRHTQIDTQEQWGFYRVKKIRNFINKTIKSITPKQKRG